MAPLYGSKTNPSLTQNAKGANQSQGIVVIDAGEVVQLLPHEYGQEYIPQKTTCDFLTRILINYIQTLEHTEFPVTTKLDAYQKKFIKEFKDQYPNYQPAELDTAFAAIASFLETPEGMVAAIKIAEWLLATLQKATGAYINTIKSHKTRYVPSINMAGNQPSRVPNRNFFQQIIAAIPGLRGLVLTEAEKTQLRMQGIMDQRTIQEKDANYYRTIVFLQENMLIYNFDGLSNAQKAYLERQGIASHKAFLGEDAENEKKRIAKNIDLITSARLDFYQAMNRPNVMLNMIKEPVQGIGQIEYVDIPDFQTQHLRIELRTKRVGAANIEEILQREIVTVTEDIKRKANERLAEQNMKEE